ncbi:hypothetical protein HMPREF9413_5512 [Paenibacillus sp. HGF7]|nr:hypothetical protein HMPREF9413_5512 [Paenibacillus sp. HGF7]
MFLGGNFLCMAGFKRRMRRVQSLGTFPWMILPNAPHTTGKRMFWGDEG